MNRVDRFIGYLSLGFAALVAMVASAQSEPPEVLWTASTPGEGVVAELAPGYTTFTLESDAEGSYTLSIDKLKDGTTLEAIEAAYAELDQSFANPEADESAAINSALEIIDAVTELSAPPGQSQTVGVVLEPGEYVLNGAVDAEQGTSQRTFHTLTVSGEPQATAPTPAVTVQLADFAIVLPETLEAGSQVWQVSNVGQQIHHMVLFKLNEGATMDDFMDWMSSEGGPPPAEDAGYVGVASSGQMSYHTLDLSVGNYIALCFLPDHAQGGDGAPHFTHGMIQGFEVANN